MAEYNPSKIIKDGNTYNFRDTTKIPLTGSNEISGSLIPSTDGTVNLGSSSAQWKDVNTVLLNGKVPAYNADVVHVKGSDDIIDSKTFISLYTQSSGPSLWMKNTSFTMGTAPTTNRYSGIWIQDNAGIDTAYIVHQANKNNSQNLKFSVSNTDGTTVYQNALTFQGRLDGTFNFYSDNPANLGTPTNKWSKVYSDDVVHTTNNETISGVKTFSNEVTMFGRDINLMSRLHYGKNSNPSSSCWHYVFFRGNTATEGYTDSWYSGFLEQLVNPDGSVRGRWVIRNTNENSMGIQLTQSADGSSSSLLPVFSSMDLGISTSKWKSFNGLNPGALSLPSNSYVNVDTTNWDLTCQNELMGSFTPTADGWLMLHVANSGPSEVNFWIIGGVLRINNKSTRNTSDNNNFNMITIPVEKDVTYNIYGNASEYVAGRRIAYCRFTPCQGNV